MTLLITGKPAIKFSIDRHSDLDTGDTDLTGDLRQRDELRNRKTAKNGADRLPPDKGSDDADEDSHYRLNRLMMVGAEVPTIPVNVENRFNPFRRLAEASACDCWC